MSTNKVKQQHYVPRSYLRRFANQNERVWVFDKNTKKSFWTHISNVAQEHLFYDPPEALAKIFPEQTLQTWEHTFALVEGAARSIVVEVIEKSLDSQQPRSTKVVTPTAKAALSIVMAQQILRTRAARNYIGTEGAEIIAPICEEEISRLGGDPSQFRLFLKSAPIQWLQHLDWFVQGTLILAPMLHSMIWTIGVTNSLNPLCTSDAPVVRSGKFFKTNVTFVGLKATNSKISYPLSPQVVLILRGAQHPQNLVTKDGTTSMLDSRQVRNLNAAQVWQSNRQVYFNHEAEQFALAHSIVGDALNQIQWEAGIPTHSIGTAKTNKKSIV